MFGKVNVQNYKVWESHTSEAQYLEKPKFRIPMFGKAKLQNSNVWKSQNSDLQ